MFEVATRKKFRFKTTVGLVTVEDLWDEPLARLNELAKALRKELRDSEEESFLDSKPAATDLNDKFEIVKYVINTKLAERDALRDVKAKKERKERILQILATKQDEALLQKTPEELLKELDDLGV